MSMFKLVLNESRFFIRRDLMDTLGLFQKNRELAAERCYVVKSRVSLSSFETFMEAVQGMAVEVTPDNCSDLKELAQEFGFSGLDPQLVEVVAAPKCEGYVEMAKYQALQKEVVSLREEIGCFEMTIEEIKHQMAEIAQHTSETMEEARRAIRQECERMVQATMERKLADADRQIQTALQSATEGFEKTLRGAVDDAVRRAVRKVKDLAKTQPVMPARQDPGADRTVYRQLTISLKDNQLHGIVYYFLYYQGANAPKDRTLSANTSTPVSHESPVHPIKAAIRLDDPTSYYMSENSDGEWYGVNFKYRLVKPTAYTIRTYPCGPGGAHLQSWNLEGYQQATDKWVVLDKRRDNQQLNGNGRVASFVVNTSELCNIIRIRMTGRNHAGTNHLALAGFEIFGTILIPDD